MKKEFGRSMIEMLGVLAIIGVLSIGGLYAYRQAMNKYKINKAIDFVNKVKLYHLENYRFGDKRPVGDKGIANVRVEVCQAYGKEYCQDFGLGLWTLYEPEQDNGSFMFSFGKVSSSICSALANKDWSDEQVKLRHIYIGRWIMESEYFFPVQNGKIINLEGAYNACNKDTYSGVFRFVFEK